MFEAFIQGWQQVFVPITFALIIAGAIFGIVLGIIPGLSSLVGCALVLPIIFGQKPEVALPLMVAISSVAVTGGSITAILVNIPGTPSNAATLINGFPMTQRGEAGRAIGAAIFSSGLGGLIGVFMALAVMPVVLISIMLIGTPEMWALVLLGIAFIGVLGAGSVTKGFISGLLGIFISLIGYQTNFGMSRFIFGSAFLYEGIALVPFTLGLFALPELVDLVQRGAIAERAVIAQDLWQQLWTGFKDIFRHLRVFILGNVVGFIVGIIPGIGADVAVWVAYGQAVKTSKHPERFGTGIVEGIIAPEAANNAKDGSALLPTLAFGIPGSAVMAILLGGFIAVGLVPGPGMLTDHLDLSFNLLITTAVANVLGVLICLPFLRYIVKVIYTSADFVLPVIAVFVFAGAFAYHKEVLDLVVLFILGTLGYGMKRFGYSRPALFLGYILGHLFEKNMFISLDLYDYALGFLLRPIVIAILLMVVLVTALDPIKVGVGKLLNLIRGQPRQ